MIDLSNVTFVIPVRIESTSRAYNFKYVIDFFTKNFKTNIIIKESDKEPKAGKLLSQIERRECNWMLMYERSNDEIFHRTRLLNVMIDFAKNNSEIICNYDIDVFMKPESYVEAVRLIVEDGYDMVYPFGKGITQKRVDVPEDDKRALNINIDLFDSKYHKDWQSLCGHCQFFKTKSYIDGGMENENFISYGAEDFERMNRFQKLGYKVTWMEGHQVYHIEHERGVNSSAANPYFQQNEKLFRMLESKTKEQLIEYYNNEPYLKKYR